MDEPQRKKVTIRRLYEMKARGERIVTLGVYDSPMAAIADSLGFDMLMTGPSGPMSLFGHQDPARIKFEEQLFMLQAVTRVTRYALVVAHMPYMSYHASRRDAVRNAARLVSEGGAEAVKCDGVRGLAPHIGAIVRAGIPVMAHVGLQASRRVEQSGYGVKGRTAEEARRIVDDARALVDVGVFGVLAEMVPTEVMQHLKETLAAPVISLGSGPIADGISLVSGDVVGYSVFPKPPHAGRFVDIRPVIQDGLRAYRDRARAGAYPDEGQAHHMTAAEYEKFQASIG